MMLTVLLRFPNGQQKNILLAGVPRVGDSIRMRNGIDAPALIVEHILWMEAAEGEQEPTVIAIVRPSLETPKV